MANESSVQVERNADGRVMEVKLDRVITDPNDELAVQIPPEADGTKDHPLDALGEPSALEVIAAHEARERDEKGANDEDE